MKRAKPKTAPPTSAQIAVVIRAARQMIADPDCWRPTGIGRGRRSAVWALIDASGDAGIDYTIPLVHLGSYVDAKSTGDMIAWGQRRTHSETLAVFDGVLAMLDPKGIAA